MNSKMAEKDKSLSQYDQAVLNRLFNPNLPYTELAEETEETDIEEELNEEEKVAREWEVKGVEAAETGNLDLALENFKKAVELAPKKASGYNNLAQALRLKGKTDDSVKYLDQAIDVSGGKGKAACQAFTQRGLVRRLHKDDEGALEDFKQAASLGGLFAKQQVVLMNPYAALCNQMLGEVMQKLRTGQELE